ncbi:MAG: prephenate dehydrogenase [Gemmatimonadota bacterium]|nr:MAG: prephenate dehydrogenase [Gemmatimonadota bacterium]
MKPLRLGVIGLGELGGSVAWQATRAGVQSVIGYARNRKDGVAAVKAGAVTEVATSLKTLIKRSEFIVIDASSSETIALLDELAVALSGTQVCCTDLGGVKGAVVQAAARLKLEQHFASSHPLTEVGNVGFRSARPDRFEGLVVYVTPVLRGEQVAREIADFWQRVMQAEAVMVDAEVHDQLVGWTSHLPQAAASMLAATLASSGPKGITYGPVALSATNAAVTDAAAWTDALVHNRKVLIELLSSFGANLDGLKTALEAGDRHSVRSWLESGSEWRRRLGK